MPQTKIYSKTKSHWDNDNDWNPAESGQGVDIHSFNLPDGEKYVRYSVDVHTATNARSLSDFYPYQLDG